MAQGRVVLSTVLLFFVVAQHGEGRLLPSEKLEKPDELQHVEATTVPTLEGLHHVATSKRVPCTWLCGPENIYDCLCVPIVPPSRPAPCTWVCGQGKHMYECQCVPDAPQHDHAKTRDATNATSARAKAAAAQAGDIDQVGAVSVAAGRSPVGPCTWICGNENNHNSECDCVPNTPQQEPKETVDSVADVVPAGAPKPVPCTWVCGQGNHMHECTCIPDAPKNDHAQTRDANNVTSAAAGHAGDVDKDGAVSVAGRSPVVPCTWICGEGNNYNYECDCVPNPPQHETREIVDSAAGVVPAGAPKSGPCT